LHSDVIEITSGGDGLDWRPFGNRGESNTKRSSLQRDGSL